MSSSAVEHHQNYIQDFDKYVSENAKPGDTYTLLKISLETQHFSPFLSKTIEPAPSGISAKKKKRVIQTQLDDIVVSVPDALKKPIKVDATNLIGALQSSADYFSQKNTPATDRQVIIFTDGLEASKINKINMDKKIPEKLPKDLSLPKNLNAEVMMIGIYPPNKSGAKEALKSFWQQAIDATGSKLSVFIYRLT